MLELKEKVFTHQELVNAAEATKIALSGIAGADLTRHKPTDLTKAINQAHNAVAEDRDSVTGQTIIDLLLAHRKKENAAIERYAATPGATCDDGTPYIEAVHKNNLSMAITNFAEALGLTGLYMSEQGKQKIAGRAEV